MEALKAASSDPTNDVIIVGHSYVYSTSNGDALDFYVGSKSPAPSTADPAELFVLGGYAAGVQSKSFSIIACGSLFTTGLPSSMVRIAGAYLAGIEQSNRMMKFSVAFANQLKKRTALATAAAAAQAEANNVLMFNGVNKKRKTKTSKISSTVHKAGDPFLGTGFVSADNERH